MAIIPLSNYLKTQQQVPQKKVFDLGLQERKPAKILDLGLFLRGTKTTTPTVATPEMETMFESIKKLPETLAPALTTFAKTTSGIFGEGLAYLIDPMVREEYSKGNIDILPMITKTSLGDLTKRTTGAMIEATVFKLLPPTVKVSIYKRFGQGALEGLGFAISEGLSKDYSIEQVIENAKMYGTFSGAIYMVYPYLGRILKAKPSELPAIAKEFGSEFTQPIKDIVKITEKRLIAQGVNPARARELATQGGFAKLPEKPLPEAQKGLPKAIPAEKGIIPQELQPLAQEAKTSIKLYKGIGAEVPNINRFAYGSHFADNPKLAEEYGKTIVSETIPKGEKIANLDALKVDYAKKGILADPQKITQDLVNKGYKWARGTLPDGQFEYVKLKLPVKTVRVEAPYSDIGPRYSYQAVKGVKEVKPIVQLPSISGTRELRGGISLTPDQYKVPRKIGEKRIEPKMIESSLSKDYQKMGISSSEVGEIVKAEKVISPNEINPVKLGTYQKLKDGVNKYWQGIREFVEDDWIRIKNLSKRKDIKITGELTPSERRSLMYGRQQTRLEEGVRIVDDIDKDILTTSKKLKIPDKKFNDLANDYLIAKHAPERNIALGEKAAGITTKEAKIRLAEIEALPYGKEVKRIADKISDYNKQVLDILYADGRPEGVITKDLYDLLRTKYKNHIPLQRLLDETTDVGGVLAGKGLDVKWSGLYRAKGSERKVADIMTNVKANFDQAIQRIEKNIVDQEALRVVRANPESGLFEIIKPKAIGKTFEGKIILDKPEGLNILSMFEKGEPVYIKINDPKLAIAFKGVNRQKLDGVMRAISSVTRFMSSLATRFNPDFAFPNKIRDIQEAVVYMASKKEIGFKGAARMSLRQKESFSAIMDAFRGKDTAGAKLYNQLKMDGGTTGGLAMSTRNQVIQDIERIRKLNRSNPRKATKYALDKISQWNTLFEDSSRLAVYKEALNRGLIRDKAAVLAKEATVDFNKMGTGGPVINALYMFSNASIQGSVKMLRAMKNPKVLGTVVATIGASVAAVNEYNDSMDPDWREKVSKWDRLNGLPIVLPGDEEKFNYIVIPVSWGLKPIKVSLDYLFDTMAGKSKGVEDAVSGILTAVMEGYNPIGGTDTISAITPSVLDIPVDVARNQAWTGSKIRPEWDKYAPNSIQYFKDLKETATGKTFIGITDKLSDTSGGRIEISPADVDYSYRQIIGGAGRFISKVVNTFSSIGKAEMPPAREIPFISRFWRSIEAERIGAGGTQAQEIRKILESQSKERFEFSQEAERLYEEMKKLPKEQARTAFTELAEKDKKMAQKIKELSDEEAKGLTYTDRLILNLGVENGERAKYIKIQLDKLKTKEEKRNYYQELIDKKIISKNVGDQIEYLLDQPNKTYESQSTQFSPSFSKKKELEEGQEGRKEPTEVELLLEKSEWNRKRLEFIKKREEVISKSPPFGLGTIKMWAKEHLPFQEKPIEIGMKNEVLRLYPWAENSQEVIKQIPIKEKLPKETPWGVETKDRLPGRGGEYQGRVYPIARAIGATVGKIDPEIIENIPDWIEKNIIFKIYKKDKILIGNPNTATIAHEYLHGIFNRTDFEIEDFNNDWEKIVKTKPQLQKIDDIIFTHPLYKDIQMGNRTELANERFAFLGANMGQGGLNLFPESLRKYYEDVFK